MSEMKPYEICLEIDRVLDDTKNFMTEEGFCYPSLHVYSRDRKLNIESDSPSVVRIVSNEDEEKYNKGKFYHSIVVFQMKSKEDDAALQSEANRIVEQYDPDGVALVLSCIFRTPEQLAQTPAERRDKNENGTRCIQICAFLREGDQDLLRVIPYSNTGKVRNVDGHVILKGQEAPEYVHNTMFVDMPWLPDDIALASKIQNPYKVVGGEI